MADVPAPPKVHSALVHAVVLSPDGKRLASAGFDGIVKVWAVGDTLTESAALTGHAGPVYAVAWLPDGRLVSASADKTARVWDVAGKKVVAEFKGHTDTVCTAAVVPGVKLVVSAGLDRSVRLWNPADGKELKNLGTHTGSVYAVAVSPDGKWVASAGGDHVVKVWDVAAMKEHKVLKGHEQPVTALTFADGATLLSAGFDRTVRVWDAAVGKETKKLGPTPDDPYGLAWAAKAKRAVLCGYSGRIAVWDTAAGKEGFVVRVLSPGYGVAVDPDAKTVFTGHDNGGIAVTRPK